MKFLFLGNKLSCLPPIYSLKIPSTNFGTMFIPFKTRLKFMGDTLSKACFTLKKHKTNPSSSPLSLAGAAKNRMANYFRRIFTYFLKPWVGCHYSFRFPLQLASMPKSISHKWQNIHNTIPLGEDTLNTNSSVSESDFLQRSPERTSKEKLCFARKLTLSFSVFDFPQHGLVCFSILTLLPRTAFQFVLVRLSLPYHPSQCNCHSALLV